MFGVPPNTSTTMLISPPVRKNSIFKVIVETTTTAREMRALPAQSHIPGLVGHLLMARFSMKRDDF
jgi:hypothetical protein